MPRQHFEWKFRDKALQLGERTLMLGVLTRLGGLAGFAMALNLWAGLYVAPNEWPWTYFFLVVIMALFTVHPPGRSLGLDVLLRRRAGTDIVARVVALAS